MRSERVYHKCKISFGHFSERNYIKNLLRNPGKPEHNQLPEEFVTIRREKLQFYDKFDPTTLERCM